MPSRGTTARNIRVADEVWKAAQERAAAEGTTVSTLVQTWLREYVMPPPPAQQVAPDQ